MAQPHRPNCVQKNYIFNGKNLKIFLKKKKVHNNNI